MSDSRTGSEVKTLLQSSSDLDPQQLMQFYDGWAETYEQDMKLMNLRAAHVAVEFLVQVFSGVPEAVQVLDVACGSGLIAQRMAELGFRHFVGVDGSQGMLDQAAQTGLYQDLQLALLGAEELPAQSDAFDVVIICGGLDAGFVPVRVVRELCHAAKPGGLVCMSRGDHTRTPSAEYKKDLERELQLMEAEGLWSPVGLKHTDRYMENPHVPRESVKDEQRYISGTVYLYRKCLH